MLDGDFHLIGLDQQSHDGVLEIHTIAIIKPAVSMCLRFVKYFGQKVS
jgi:hypothetical protein